MEAVEADVSTVMTFPRISVAGFSDIPGSISGITFTESRFQLTVQDMPFSINPMQLSLQSLKNGVQQSISANINAPANATTVLTMDKNGVNNNGASTTIVNLISSFPQNFAVSGTMEIFGLNIDLEYGTPYPMPYIFSVPFDVAAPNGLIENTKTLLINKGVRDVLDENFVEAEMRGEIVNNSAFTGTVRYAVGPDTGNVTNVLLEDVLLPATVDGSGRVTAPVTYTITAALDLAKIRQILDARHYKFSVELEVNRGVVRESDHIILRNVYLSGLGKIKM